MGTYKLRDYQQAASDAAVRFFNDKTKKNGIIIAPTGSGKSLIISDIASKIKENVLVFQPSKEILEQNYAKMLSYGCTCCSIYSASFGSKEISRITFATIGSVANHIEDFRRFKYIIIDEAHLVNAKGGQYMDFIQDTRRKVVGLTATPYRLSSSFEGSMLKFLTRTRPRVFSSVLYEISIQRLMSQGFLAKLRYFDMQMLDASGVRKNTTGSDYDDKSLKEAYIAQNLYDKLVDVVRRLQKPKNGVPRKGILVFTRYIEESERLAQSIEGCAIVTGETPKKERERILNDFKAGKIPVVTNVGVLTTGFDFPALDTVVMARPTMSLSMYYQIVGRAIRPFEGKEGWFVDLCGNIGRFGKVDDLRVDEPWPGGYIVNGVVNGRLKQLTNVVF